MSVPTDLRSRTRSHGDRLAERGFRLALIVAIGIGIVSLGLLLGYVINKGLPRLNADLFNRFPSSFPEKAGAKSALFGTLWVMGISAVLTVLLGVGAAIYLEEFARRDRAYNRLIELNVQNLAAVPSIVYGILGLAFIVRAPLSLGPVVLAGGLILALLVLPIVIIASREALRAVPPSIREASFGLGATPVQAAFRTTVPAAVPGIATGVILGLSRAIGEAAPLLMLGAASFINFTPTGFDSRFTTLPVQIFSWISKPQPGFQTLAAAASIVLLGLLLLMNATAIWLRNRYQRRW